MHVDADMYGICFFSRYRRIVRTYYTRGNAITKTKENRGLQTIRYPTNIGCLEFFMLETVKKVLYSVFFSFSLKQMAV